MTTLGNQKYVVISALIHGLVLCLLIVYMDQQSPLPVVQNTNKNDIISAVVLGDSPQSKILPTQPLKQTAQQEVKQEPVKQAASKLQSAELEQIKKDIIALRETEKKKTEQRNRLAAKKQRDLFAKELLADIKQQKDKQTIAKQKQLKSQFEKTLRETTELSLREQLLNEEIVLKGVKTRQAQGEVNKYKALIIQVISSHWIVPPQANKSLYSELMIRLAPGGMVIDVQITKSSGDPALDSSARAAVLKSSPLPVPKDADAFEAFRQFVLKVKPENILSENSGIGSG